MDFIVKSARFHPEICQISCLKFGRFHAWNLADFMDEIWWISCMKSGGFHSEIQQISWMKSSGFHAKDFIYKYTAYLACNVYLSVLDLSWMSQRYSILVVDHEICQISWWNPPNFIMKFGEFHAKWAKDQWSYFYHLFQCKFVGQIFKPVRPK